MITGMIEVKCAAIESCVKARACSVGSNNPERVFLEKEKYHIDVFNPNFSLRRADNGIYDVRCRSYKGEKEESERVKEVRRYVNSRKRMFWKNRKYDVLCGEGDFWVKFFDRHGGILFLVEENTGEELVAECAEHSIQNGWRCKYGCGQKGCVKRQES